jgi:type I restriction-modification system DNA methylase subunit
MTEFQSGLTDHQRDVNQYTSDLTAAIRDAAGSADSEIDFSEQIRADLDGVMNQFGIGFDYVNTQIGSSLSIADVEAVLENQDLSFSDVPFGPDDIHEGGQQPDAVAGASVTDYKNPGELSTQSGRKSALGQLAGYMITVADVQNVDVSDTAGVVTDGEKYLFLHGDDLSQAEQRHVNEGSTEEYIHLLVGHWAVLTVDRILSDFGDRTSISINAVNAFYNALEDPGNRSEKFFEEWKLLFEQVCGFDFDEGAELLEEQYGLDIQNDEEYRKALFALYTYYALIAKLLAAEFVHYHQDSRFLSFMKKLIGRSDDELRNQMDQFEEGWVFKDSGIDNFLEVSLFSWYTESAVWDDDISEAILDIAQRMRKYDPGKIREEPQEARDLFKKLYQHLVPDELRNQLGEVFTPDWLAELTIEKSGYNGEGSVLDPTCGSGTFLVFAARQKKERYREQHGDELSDEQKEEVAKKILNEIEGFDLNPLAVLSARTNLLIEMGELLSYHTGDVPVYLADSVRPPELSSQITGSFYTVEEIPTESDEGELESSDDYLNIKIPQEIIDRDLVNDYFDLAKKYTLRGVSSDQFVQSFREEYGIEEPRTESAIQYSYQDVSDLHDRDANGVWWGIVKNRFRPHFCGKFDYVLGNPPWITLDNLADDYRDKIKSEWREYDILPDGAQAQKKIEHGLLFTCVSIDEYLKSPDQEGQNAGELSFLLPLTAQRGGAAGKFRKHLSDNTEVLELTDVADLNPFDVTKNRPLIVSVRNGNETDFPVPCDTWIGDRPPFDARLNSVDIDRHDFVATYLGDDPTGKWYSAPSHAISAFKKIHGESDYEAHEGVGTEGGHGLFFIDIIDGRSNLIENTNIGHKQWDQVRTTVDPNHVFPAAKGSSVNKWRYSTPRTLLIPHKETGEAYSEEELRTTDTWDFLYHDGRNQDVGDRKWYGTPLKDTDHPNHILQRVTERNFSEYKTIYQNITGGTYVDFEAVTLGPEEVLGEEKPVMFDHSINYIDADSKGEAYYLSGILNSACIRAMMRAHSVLNLNPRAIEEVDIPTFDEGENSHTTLAKLSEGAHQLSESAEVDESISAIFDKPTAEVSISDIELKIDEVASDIFDITEDELDSLRYYLEITRV